MSSPSWHARIDWGGTVAGSGFLVSDRHVLTCAHVVQDLDRATVSFPGSPALAPTTAEVVVRGPWAGGSRDRGDMAVLALGEPVALRPAVFAPLDSPYGSPYAGPPPKLVAYGFPVGYEEGVLSELRVVSRQLISDEWTQLEDWKGYGQELAPGFSGSAAVLEGSGAVVGMVSANDPDTRNGRMIPAQVLARHWPRLADLIPTPGYDGGEKRRLRELVVRTQDPPRATVHELFRSSVGPLGIAAPAGGPLTLWDAVWHLLSEGRPRAGALPLAELTVRLADVVADAGLGRELRRWSREHRARFDERSAGRFAGPGGGYGRPGHPAAAGRCEDPGHGDAGRFEADRHGAGRARPAHDDADRTAAGRYDADRAAESRFDAGRADAGRYDADHIAAGRGAEGRFDPHGADAAAPRRAAPRWSPILVEVTRSGVGGHTLLVQVSAFRGGHRELVGEKRLTKAELRDWALDRIDDAFGHIDTDGRQLIAFALPRTLVNLPVDRWARRSGDRRPLGCRSPVVVMDHDRRENNQLQFKLKQMWDVLDGYRSCDVHRVACDSAESPDRLSVRLQDVYAPVGFARPPKQPRVGGLHRAALDAPAPIVMWPRTGCTDAACAGDCTGSAFLDTLAGHLSRLSPADLPQHVFELRKKAFLYDGGEPHWATDLSLVWEDPRWFPAVLPLTQSPVV